jgi:predicted nucleic acid-binding protein
MKSKEKVFFDSNVFLYHLGGVKDRATELLEMVENGEVTGYINDVMTLPVLKHGVSHPGG